MPFPLGSVFEAAGSLGSGLIGGLFNAHQAAKNRQFQREMYQRQYDDSIAFWKMQNEYNLPSAMLQRWKDAGLDVNPLLMFGQGTLTGNVAQNKPDLPSAGSGAQAQASFSNPFAGFGLMDAQRKNLESVTDLNEAKIDEAIAAAQKLHAEAIKSYSESGKLDTEKEFNIRSMDARIEQTHTENRLKRLLGDTEQWKQDEIKKNIEKADTEIDFVENQIYNNTRMTDQQIEESKTRISNAIKLTSQQIATLKADERKALADAWLASEKARTEGAVRDKIVEKYEAEIAKAISEGTAQDIENIMNMYAWDKMPAPGSNAWKWSKWWDTWVKPVTSSIGSLLGGAVAGTGAAAIKKK